MKKILILILAILSCIILAGIYGVIHDQVTYSISNEYFTKFKYQQFGFDPTMFGGDRQTVGVIGFLATWWTGLIIGFILSLTAFFAFKNPTGMKNALRKAIPVTFVIAIVSGFVGFLIGKYILPETGIDWLLPENILDRNAFVTVGSIHNFSYLGGLIGLIAGIIIIIKKSRHSLKQIEKE